MNRSDREQRDAERAARRARRLADRAEQRAERRADQAQKAHARAERLAERARRKPSRERDRDRSFEDYVDDVTERWERKAEAWFSGESRGTADAGDDPFGIDDMGLDDMDDMGMDDMSDMTDTSTFTTDIGDGARENRARSSRRRTRSRADARSDRLRERRKRRSARRRAWRGRRNSRGLYRDKARGKVCGVCAGLADYFEIATWKVRLAAGIGLLTVPTLVVPLYFITYFLMEDMPYYRRVTDRFEEEAQEPEEAPQMSEKRSRKREAPAPEMENIEAFQVAKQKFTDIEDRLRAMETHVTSSQFELQREFRKISGDEA